MKILVVFTGGTIGSVRKGGIISPDDSRAYTLLEMYGNIRKTAEFTAVCPYTILSENLCRDNLVKLYECIRSYNIEEYDGVIVTHGTDTLQYTSSFLGYAFSDCKKPIIVVSANYPLDDSRSNGLINFAAAMDFISSGCGSGVFAAYANIGENPKIHRAVRLLAHMSYSDDVFSIFNSFYGEISGDVFVKNSAFREADNKLCFKHPIILSESSDVIKLTSYVSMAYPLITSETKAVLIEGYHSGTLNTNGSDLIDFCREANKLNVPVFLTGASEGFYYESKLLLDELKIRVLPPASPIAMYMKLWMLDREHIQDVYLPCSGDFI